MHPVRRRLRISLPQRQSAFLWGPRKTGKTTLLRALFPTSIVYDFLRTDLALDMSRRPALLREQLLARPAREVARPVILDEDAANVDILRRFGFEVYYGDITRLDLLAAAGAAEAGLMIITIRNVE